MGRLCMTILFNSKPEHSMFEGRKIQESSSESLLFYSQAGGCLRPLPSNLLRIANIEKQLHMHLFMH